MLFDVKILRLSSVKNQKHYLNAEQTGWTLIKPATKPYRLAPWSSFL